MFIFIYKGLRVGVRVRGIGLLGPNPRFILESKVYPSGHHPHVNIPTMTSQFPGGEGFPRG